MLGNIESKPLTIIKLVSRADDDIVYISSTINSKGVDTVTEYEEFLIEQYKSGKSLRQICKEQHISRNLLSEFLKSNNITIRGTSVTSRKYYCDENYFSVIDSSDKAYWVGFIAADGCIQKNQTSEYLNVTLNTIDEDHLVKLNNSLKSTYQIKQYNSSGYNINGCFSRLLISSHTLVTDLQKYGVTFQKTNQVRVLNIPDDFKKDYIRGYIDGNGSLFIGSNGYPTLKVCGSYDVMKYILDYFEKNIKICSNKNCFDITFHGNYVVDLVKTLYSGSTTYLTRKYNKALEIINIRV